ncbi:uncharacterized oxidoreductase TM_0325-like [Protopterus annectens]|uniref:uncharacterized oxidoreductase TM_0325-like n=1 Tax=Protopterus annectens TaxID=7888 RepID=UPI001CFAB3A8|nr:uncharacterized oxidoreductase TM_0325-like [Protopterus annectens]
MLSIKGKVALITGASSGTGAATSILFAELGVKVVLNGRNVERLKETAKQCDETQKEKPLMYPGSLPDEAVARNIIQDTVAHFGQLDVLVNNAEILAMGSIEKTSLEQYDQITNTNIRFGYLP